MVTSKQSSSTIDYYCLGCIRAPICLTPVKADMPISLPIKIQQSEKPVFSCEMTLDYDLTDAWRFVHFVLSLRSAGLTVVSFVANSSFHTPS